MVQVTDKPRTLSAIAFDIRAHWVKMSPYAKPYLDAMIWLRGMDDNFHSDDARSIVRYFLANASGWRGDDAKRIKAELNGML